MKKILPIVVAVAVAGALGFLGGMSYGQRDDSQIDLTRAPQGFQNFTPEERQQMGISGLGSGVTGERNIRGGFVGGEIIGKDDKTVTIKLQDEGSKIVFISSSTAIMKLTQGLLSDLVSGEQISVSGSSNSDGSITAQSIQIRPKPKTN